MAYCGKDCISYFFACVFLSKDQADILAAVLAEGV
jgi:hypothetical protein